MDRKPQILSCALIWDGAISIMLQSYTVWSCKSCQAISYKQPGTRLEMLCVQEGSSFGNKENSKLPLLCGHAQHSNQTEEETHHRIGSVDAEVHTITSVVHTTIVELDLLLHETWIIHLGERRQLWTITCLGEREMENYNYCTAKTATVQSRHKQSLKVCFHSQPSLVKLHLVWMHLLCTHLQLQQPFEASLLCYKSGFSPNEPLT